MAKPEIICYSKDDAEVFDWVSGGWYSSEDRGKPEAEALFAKANRAIGAAKDVPDAIRLLQAAGFRVVRAS